MRVQEVLDLARVDVLAAANDGVLGAALEAEVAVGVHDGEVAGVQPAFGVDGLGGGRGIVVVALHHQIAARAQFALLFDGHALPDLGIDDLHFGVGQRARRWW